MTTVDTGHIVIDPDVLSGEPHILGHRIGVSDIAIWIAYQGRLPAEVAATFHLTLGEVYAALAYYYDHQEKIDHDIQEADRRAEELAKQYPRGWQPAKDGDHANQ